MHPQAIYLFGIQKSIEELMVAVESHQFALRYVTQIRTNARQIGGGNLGEEVIRHIKVQVAASQITGFLLLHLIDLNLSG
jgi:hypothetical protein